MLEPFGRYRHGQEGEEEGRPEGAIYGIATAYLVRVGDRRDQASITALKNSDVTGRSHPKKGNRTARVGTGYRGPYAATSRAWRHAGNRTPHTHTRTIHIGQPGTLAHSTPRQPGTIPTR